MPVTQHAPTIESTDPALLQRWRKVAPAFAADLVRDPYGRSVQIDPAIRALCAPGKQPPLFGRAVTAQCAPPDFGPVLYAADLIGPGDVLVIAAQGQSETGMIGEIVTGHMRRNGGVGVVCDGAIRDVGMIASWPDFSAYTRHVTPRGPASAETGAVNVPVVIGGRLVSPGDLLIGDDDGLVSLCPATLISGIEACEDKLAKEALWEESLSSGKSLGQTFSLPPASDPA